MERYREVSPAADISPSTGSDSARSPIAPRAPAPRAPAPLAPAALGYRLASRTPRRRYFIAPQALVTGEGAPYLAWTTRIVPSGDTITVKMSS